MNIKAYVLISYGCSQEKIRAVFVDKSRTEDFINKAVVEDIKERDFNNIQGVIEVTNKHNTFNIRTSLDHKILFNDIDREYYVKEIIIKHNSTKVYCLMREIQCELTFITGFDNYTKARDYILEYTVDNLRNHTNYRGNIDITVYKSDYVNNFYKILLPNNLTLNPDENFFIEEHNIIF